MPKRTIHRSADPLTMKGFIADAWQRDLAWHARSVLAEDGKETGVEVRLLVGPAMVWTADWRTAVGPISAPPPPFSIVLYHTVSKQALVLWSGTVLEQALSRYNNQDETTFSLEDVSAWLDRLRDEPL